jgi:peptidyl-prolyl cis-trans isomerase B (cyclophilin B)
LSRAQTAHLDRKHTCFGKLTEGMDVLDTIAQGDSIDKVIIHEN